MKHIILLILNSLVFIIAIRANETDSISILIESKNLIIKNLSNSFVIRDIIYDELSSNIVKEQNGLYLIYDYSASATKSNVYFHFSIKNKVVIMNKIYQFILDDKTGVTIGWEILLNDSLINTKLNRDVLESFTSFCKYEIMNNGNKKYTVSIRFNPT